MQSIPHFYVILSLVMLAGARPAISDRALRIPLKNNAFGVSSSHSVTRERLSCAEKAERLVSYAHKKYMATFAAYERNTGSRHPLDAQNLSSSLPLSKRDMIKGKDDLQDDDAELYYGNFGLGTPSQTFTADFDTGSADLWLSDKNCLATCYGHHTYDPSKSSSSREQPDPHAMIYGSGEAITVNRYSDVLQLAGYKVEDQEFATAALMSNQFWKDEFPPDGLFGLGFREISALGVTPPVESLNNSEQLPQSFLSFMLSDVPGRSELIVGGANHSAFKNDTLVRAPVTVKGYWQIVLEALFLSTSHVPVGTDYPAIVDTGTTLIVVPKSVADHYFGGVPGAQCTINGVCTVPCDKIESTTPKLRIEGRDFKVCSSTWNFGPVSPGSPSCVTGMGVLETISFIIVGDVFMRNVYTIFDFGDLSVRFADLVDPVC